MTEKLKREVSLAALVIYGVGDILGAGIYGLIGKAAAELGNAIWLGFLASMLAASFTGLSYASLGSRYPKAGGAAYITQKAFKNSFLSYMVGLAALASGLTSMAAGSRAFSGYFSNMFDGIPTQLVLLGFCLTLTFIVIRGIKESLWMNLICTSIELGGLLLIIVLGFSYIGDVNYLDSSTVSNPSGDLSLSLILSGAVLTFYSFIGFEDMLNLSEEVKEPQKNMPLGILLAVGISSVIYILISLIAVSVLPATDLAQSSAPLVEVVKVAAPWMPVALFGFIAMFAVANTALLNFIMGSRLVYGMAQEQLLPRFLGKLSRQRGTPYTAAMVISVLMISLAIYGDISTLARATSVLLLSCFCIVNVSLIILKRRKSEPVGRFEVPYAVPVLGTLICLAMLSQARFSELTVAGMILVGIAILYWALKPQSRSEKI